MDAKVACLLLIILGALTVQGAVSGNKRTNPLHARQYGEGEYLFVPLMTPAHCHHVLVNRSVTIFIKINCNSCVWSVTQCLRTKKRLFVVLVYRVHGQWGRVLLQWPAMQTWLLSMQREVLWLRRLLLHAVVWILSELFIYLFICKYFIFIFKQQHLFSL